MKRNFLLALTCGCALTSFCAEPAGMNPLANDDSEPILKPAVVKEFPSGEMIVETPKISPVVNMAKIRKATKKGWRLDSLVSTKPDGTFYSKQIFVFDDNGKILKQEDFLYNATSKSWTMSNTYLWGWNDKGYMTFDEQVTSKGNSVRNEYKYNAQNLGIEKVTLRRTGFDGEYVNYRKGEYDYDDRGNMTKENLFNWTNNDWVPSTKTDATYDKNNFRATIEIWTYKNGVWTGKDKQDTEYNIFGKNTKLISYSWERKEKGKFAPFSRMTNVFRKDTIAAGQDIDYFNIDDNDWTGNFIDSNKVERYNIHAATEFDSRDRATRSFSSKFVNNQWRIGSETNYVYTDKADGSYKCVRTNKVRSLTMEEFREQEIVTTEVDTAGRTIYYYDNYIPKPNLGSEWFTTFDAKGNNIAHEEYKFNTSGQKYHSLKYENKFDEYGNIIETYNWNGKKNAAGLADDWKYNTYFTYAYEQNGTVRVDKKSYRYDEAKQVWTGTSGDGGDFDYTVKTSEIVVPQGYNSIYMQTAKYQYKWSGSDWDTTKFTYYHSKLTGGVDETTIGADNSVTFGNNILRVNGGTNIDNSVYSTDGKLVFRGNNAQEDLGNLGNGLYIVRSIVDGKVHSLKVIVK